MTVDFEALRKLYLDLKLRDDVQQEVEAVGIPDGEGTFLVRVLQVQFALQVVRELALLVAVVHALK